MNIEALARYGLPDQVIRCWDHEGIRFLLPIQSESVMRYGLIEGKSLIISGPGTSGKTFCGEMAAMACASARGKTVFLMPLKAVAEEKYRIFNERYQSLGIKSRLATRDHSAHESDINRCRFDIAITIYEKFNALTASDISIIKSASCFILDEFQMISEPKRGMEFELALLKIRKFNPGAQVIILIGGGASPERISQWSGLAVLDESRRPVDLRLGILHRGKFHFRGFNDLKEGDEHWLSQIDLDDTGGFNGQSLAAIKYLSAKGEQILIFISTRRDALALAEALAHHLDLPPAESALAALKDAPPSLQNEVLERCLHKGIAFHHAELDESQREIVESGFRDGSIKILTSTSTLASGVNLPAKNVFIEAYKYSGNKSLNCRETLMPLSGVDYHQAAGRAGRLGSQQSFGRAIMTASTQYEHEVLWDKYIYGKCEEPQPGMTLDQLPDFALRLISCGASTTPDELSSAIGNTYAGKSSEFGAGIKDRLIQALVSFEKSGLANIKSWGKIEPTRLGEASCSAGIRVNSAIEIAEWLQSGLRSPFDCLLFSMRLGEWTDEASGYNCRNFGPDMIIFQIEQVIDELNQPHSPYIETTLREFHDKKMKMSLAGFLFALEWISGKQTCDIEAELGKGAGGLKRDASNICWILRSIEKIAKAVLPSKMTDAEIIHGLDSLIDRLQLGVPESMLPLATGLKIDREFIRRIYDSGLISLDHLYDCDMALLNSILPRTTICQIKNWRRGYKPHDNAPVTQAISKLIPRLIFTGRQERFQSEVVIDSRSIFLQPRLYGYLHKFWLAYLDKTNWVHKDSLDSGLNQTKYISKLRGILREHEIKLDIVSNGRCSYALKFLE
jgi:helicase